MTVTIKIYRDLSNQLDPNCYTVGRDGNQVLMLCCHNTAGPNDTNNTDPATAQRLSDAAAIYLTSNSRQASVHWLVGAEACGAPIYKIVPEKDTAYHCGGPDGMPSHWTDPDTKITYTGYGNNLISVGIELFGQAKDVVGPNQLNSLKSLVLDIYGRYSILQNTLRIIAHADIDKSRTDGLNWRDSARKWVKDATMNPNPNNLNVGAGFIGYLTQINEQAATEERYIKNAPGGVSVLRTVQGSLLMATQDIGANGAYLASWTITKLA